MLTIDAGRMLATMTTSTVNTKGCAQTLQGDWWVYLLGGKDHSSSSYQHYDINTIPRSIDCRVHGDCAKNTTLSDDVCKTYVNEQGGDVDANNPIDVYGNHPLKSSLFAIVSLSLVEK